MDEAHRAARRAAGDAPDKAHHPCFSKHLAIVEASEKSGWPLDTYASIQHPHRARLSALLESLLGRAVDADVFVTDGCGLPTPILPLAQLAELYRRLAIAPAGSPLAKARDAMLAAPEWVGGPGRLDTELMRRNAGVVVAKEGADGLLAIGILPTAARPDGAGVALKLFAGYEPSHASVAIAPLLEALGLEPEPLPVDERALRYGEAALEYVGVARGRHTRG